MTAQISLTASMRSNLLNLQNISRQVNSIQNRLATGNKVNSAIDNPSNYYTARSLNNRAGDLNALLDSMGQAVSTIKAATTALESGADFLEQAAAIATQALEKDEDFSDYTWVNTKEELLAALDDPAVSQILVTKSLTFLPDEFITVNNGKTLRGINSDITLAFTNTSDRENIKAIDLSDTGVLRDISVSYTKTSSVSHISTAVSGGHLEGYVNINTSGYRAFGVQKATISGQVDVTTSGKGGVGINDSIINGTIYVRTSGNDAYGVIESTINGTANVITNGVYADAILNTNINGTVNAMVNDSLPSCIAWVNIGSQAKVNIFRPNGGNGIYQSSIQPAAEIWIAENGQTEMSQYEITAHLTNVTSSSAPGLSAYSTGNKKSAENFKIQLENAFDNHRPTDSNSTVWDNKKIFTDIIKQYDSIIKDGSYKGTNLLTNDNLNVRFNETGSANLNVSGKDMSAAALGLNTTDWQAQADIVQSLSEISAALKSSRSFAAELGNNYSIITNRQDFTENLINILTEGADKLTLADMNEESANMLALQTRQLLAINSLSLASQASQAVLKLF